ncbi:MAG: SAM-dependent methyltransferase [Minicystis sp.]
MKIDITRPQIGRIYDYVLGGTYNYEADRRAAQQMIEVMPAYPRLAWQNRAFLADVGRRWAAEGRRRVLDLGSGLPTQGHFNEHMPSAKILFTDVDPITVAQAQQLLAYTPDMACSQVDLREPDVLLEQAEAFFGDNRVLAVGAIGIIYFLADDDLRRLMQRLHAFCAPGSVLALSFPEVPELDVLNATVAALSESARIGLHLRSPEQLAELIAPWRMISVERLEERFGEGGPAITQPDHPMHQTKVRGAFAER